MNDIIAKIFENRGYNDNFLENITACNHKLPNNIHTLCNRLEYYRQSQDLIVIVTDFDLDGIMSGTIALSGFAELGFNVALYVYDVSYGYGFDGSDITAIMQQYPNVKAIITGDVGITAFDGVDAAKAAGLEVFITDHHKPSKDGSMVHADIIVDPCCDPDDYGSYSSICGANVMYQILSCFAEHHMGSDSGCAMRQIERLRVFAGFGTISDSMPVYYENRPLIQDSISICKMLFGDGASQIVHVIPGNDIYRRAFLGLYNLLMAYKDAGKLSQSSDIDEDFIGYYIAPMFNSVKRMDGDLHAAYDVFFGGDEASKKSIDYLFDLNEQRKVAVIEKSEEMYEHIQKWEPYIYITDAKTGIRGLLAQDVLGVTGLPAIVLAKDADGRYSGSGRCPYWFPFLSESVSTHWRAAGHDSAFGVGCDTEKDVIALYKFLKKRVKELKPSDAELAFRPDFTVSTLGDGDFDLDFDLLSAYLNELKMCRPFGVKFPKPVSVFRFFASECIWTIIGKDRTHVKLVMPNGVSILCFNQAKYFTAVTNDGMIDADELPDVIEVVGDFSFNEFNDMKSLQFIGEIRNDSIVKNHEFVADIDAMSSEAGFEASEGIVLDNDFSALLSIAQSVVDDNSNIDVRKDELDVE